MRTKSSYTIVQVACLASIIFASGCVTSSKKSTPAKKQPTEVVKDKPGSKDSPANNQAATKPDLPPVPTTDQQLNFFRSHVNSESAFGDEDIYFLSTIPKSPETGSVSEAVLTIGILRSVINPLANTIKPTFEERDLNSDALPSEAARSQNGSSTPSIEKLFKEQKIDLADALAENPLLGSWSVAALVRQALVAGSDTPDYQNEIVNILKRTAAKWSQLDQGLGGNAPSDETPREPKLMTDTYGNIYDANAPTNGDDSTIAEAQKLADAGRWQEAIKMASSVGKDHPSYPLAQERIDDYSNKAVQVLRKKAAAAFQSAIPITDVKTRAQYLRQAKSYLEDAIKNYPQASQLPTVRDNLRVISRDLDKLESEAGG